MAFSIAIQTEADIFLVDEALAVGDMEFQEKCLDRFREFRKEKKSIILASHNLDVVRSFCENTLYLAGEEARAFGSSQEATYQYVEDMKTTALGR